MSEQPATFGTELRRRRMAAGLSLAEFAKQVHYSKGYLGIARTDDLVIIQITANNTRTVDQKKAFFRQVAENLAADPRAAFLKRSLWTSPRAAPVANHGFLLRRGGDGEGDVGVLLLHVAVRRE